MNEHYRVVAYLRDLYGTTLSSTHEHCPFASGAISRKHAIALLEQLVASAECTGGHIEVYVKQIGWVLDENEDQTEAEICRLNAAVEALENERVIREAYITDLETRHGSDR